ncbi:MAG: hypothetical protein A2W85_15150 [Bacteroidetes bacterium GWF2_41_31]|nr:MAG: hypothetical protein A2W85_15150 [Bacteroidetes bacterium GWF2_41_31]OFZ08751.1 MAG: hypothetical protein A2338_06685 [Bacteroidetes bacterium RIFOXYB12_FULL_41_6]
MKLDKSTVNIVGSFVVIVVLALSIQACTIERKTAVAFTKKANVTSLIVLQPDQLFKINQKLYLLDSLGPVDEDREAEVLLENSLFLKDLNDSRFVDNYMLGYKNELARFGFHVYDASTLDKIPAKDSNVIQVSVAQIELEETLYPFRDETQIYGQNYFHDHQLNAVFVNSWFDITPLNNKSSIYFATDMLVDQVESTFDYDVFSDQVRYMYNLEPMSTDMLYQFAYDLGRVYAGYTFDYLLNTELDRVLPPEDRTDRYWRYDPFSQTFFLAGEDRFISLEE